MAKAATVLELVTETNAGAGNGGPGTAVVFNGQLFFEATNASGNDEPFRFDGTNLFQITNGNPPAAGDSNLTDQFVFNGNLYAVMESSVGRELFQYNAGTDTYDLHTNLNGASDGFPRPERDENGDLVIFNNDLVLVAEDSTTGEEPFRLRQDNNQLELLVDVGAGAAGSFPSNFTVFNGQLFFEADTAGGFSNQEPHRFDGTTLTQIPNGDPSAGDSNVTSQFKFNGNLYAVMESSIGRELFQYNTGTGVYDRITNFATNLSFPQPMSDPTTGDLIIFNTHLVMQAEDDTSTGVEPYRLRSDNNQLELLVDVVPGTGDSRPSNFVAFNGQLFFEGTNGSGNDEPFRFDGTNAIQITNASPPAGDSNLTTQFQFEGDLYAVMDSNVGRELFKYDPGTDSYDVMTNLNGAGDGFPIPLTSGFGSGIVIYNGAMMFNAADTGIGRELFQLRLLGTPADISINDVTLAEGNAGTTAFSFTVTRSDNSSASSVDFATANASATAGTDYTAASGTVNFAAGGALTQTVTVNVSGDTTVELNETFQVNLSNPSAFANIVDGQGIGTIQNDDAATLAINDVSMVELDSGSTSYTFTTTLSNAVDTAVTVNAATADSSATTADSDYATASGSLNFAGTAGETETFSVTVNGDTVVELDETFFVNLSGLAAGGRNVSLADSQGLGTIQNNDSATLSIDDQSAVEGDAGTTAYTFTVTLDSDIDAGFTVDYAAADSTATTADSDYTAANGTLTFAGTAGETQTLTVNANGDTQVELDEQFLVNLSNIQAGGRAITLADGQGAGTIQNDDSATLSIADLSMAEGDAGTTAFSFTVTLDAAVDSGLSVDFASADDTATTADNDYAMTSGTVNFTGTAGETQSATVNVNGDVAVEPDENFFVNLSNVAASGRSVSIADGQAVGTILNDDAASLSIDDVSQAEGDAGTTAFTFTVTADTAAGSAYTVDFATADDTATSAGDYAAASGTLNFAGTTAGETQTLTVNVNGDAVTELDESFFVNLSNIQGGGGNVVLGDGQGVGTVTNDDATTLAIDDVSMNEGDSGTTTFSFTVTATGAVDVGYSVDFASADDSATVADNDYVASNGTLNFTGSDGESTTASVSVNGDVIAELDEAFLVNLSNVQASGRDVTLADSQGAGAVLNDDIAELSISSPSVTEGDSGTTQLIFEVTLSTAITGGLTVDFATSDGSASSAEGDYVPTSGTLTFVGNAGEVQQIVVDVNGDTRREFTETVIMTLSNVNAGGISVTLVNGGQAQGSIITDEAIVVPVWSDLGRALLLLLMLASGFWFLRRRAPFNV